MYTESNYPEVRRPIRRRRRKRKSYLHHIPSVLFLVGILMAGCCLISSAHDGAPKDTEAPGIYGVQDLTVYAGNTLAYRSGITVTDDLDPAPRLDVDSSAADLSTPGSYPVIYTATDASGNQTSQTATVTVLPQPEEAAPEKDLEDAAETILSYILLDGMTTEEQVQAIYNWAHNDLSYSGHSDKSDWRQAAGVMLTERRGDCFGYFAVTKLMFELLEIPNIDVRKVKNHEEDSDHYWSLVSVDGGKTYYHFDATPRIGQVDDFCLVTDAFLDAYSEANKNSHNRDKTLYPATPEE